MRQLREVKISPKHMILRNRRNGFEREFILRPYRRGDEEGMMSCVREEYGESYFKKFFYDRNLLLEKADGNSFDFFVAETDGRIAGIEIFSYFLPEETYIEPASQILGREFRGYGLSKALVEYTFSILEGLMPSAIFVHAVTFHALTQKTCERQGMVPTGFRLGSFLTERMSNSYPKGRCEKYSEGIMIKPVAKKDAGTVYLPGELYDFGQKIYRRLGVGYRIETDGHIPDTCPAKCSYSLRSDENQQFIQIQLTQTGRDLGERMEELIHKYRGKGCWSIQMALCCDTPCVLRDYRLLRELGFFFTGLKPLCGPHEQFYMQWIDDWKLCLEDYVLTEHFQEIRRDIEGFYRGRTL